MRSRLAAGLVALCLPLLGVAGPAHAAVTPVEYHYDDGGYCAADHDGCYGDGGGSDGNTGYDGEGGRSGDMDQSGDGNCRNFCFYGVPMPGGEGRGQSLFPPSPEAIRDFVLATFKAGIEMGRLFADTTITFVADLFVGIA